MVNSLVLNTKDVESSILLLVNEYVINRMKLESDDIKNNDKSLIKDKLNYLIPILTSMNIDYDNIYDNNKFINSIKLE